VLNLSVHNFEILDSGIARTAADGGHRIKLDRDESSNCRWSCLCGASGTRSKARDRRADAELHCYLVTGLRPPDPGPSGWERSELTPLRGTEQDHEPSEPSELALAERRAITLGTAEHAINLVKTALQ
jgi:hypothetical protein